MTLYVIVPIYNASRYISEALHSILDRRDLAPFATNIVLVNDGSTDNSEEICEEFAKRYSGVEYIYQKNQGVSVARNTGLQYVFQNCASDDWIGFLDADDTWNVEWISALKQCQCSDADVIGFGMAFADELLKIQEEIKPESSRLTGGADTAISENRKMHFGAYLYRVALLMNNEILFIPRVKNGEDLAFKYCAFSAASRIEYFPCLFYIYRRNGYSVTSNLEKQAMEYYGVFILSWRGLIDWFAKRAPTDDNMQMLNFAKVRNNCTCMYAARSYCIWHNGSFAEFKKDVIDELLLHHLLQPVSYENDISLRRDYKCLMNEPRRFYIKYYLLGTGEKIKQRIRKIIKLYASK